MLWVQEGRRWRLSGKRFPADAGDARLGFAKSIQSLVCVELLILLWVQEGRRWRLSGKRFPTDAGDALLKCAKSIQSLGGTADLAVGSKGPEVKTDLKTIFSSRW